MSALTRRELLAVGAAAGGGLLIGWRVEARPRSAGSTTPAAFVPNQWIRIGKDGRVTLVVSQVEVGQGTYTSMPMILAEELEVELAKVHVEPAPPDDKLYGLPGFGVQLTGASTSVQVLYQPLRKAGATARTMLIAAAAQAWKVDPSSCSAQKGTVKHTATGRTLSYGALAEKAATIPVPAQVTLKDPKDFKLIGTPAKRLDTPAKVNGTAQFGFDVRVPGMKVAAITLSPVVGGKLASVDDSKSKAIKGVRQVVRLDDAVAVVADHLWAARQGLEALSLRWDDGPNGTVSTADIVKELATASQSPGVAARKRRRRSSGDRQGQHQARGHLRGTLPRACRDGATELHRARTTRPVRGVGRNAVHHPGPGRGREGERAPGGEGHLPQPVPRRRVRAPAGFRLGSLRGPRRPAGRRAGEGRVDA